MLTWLVLHVNQRLSDTLISNLIVNVDEVNIYKIAMMSLLQKMLKRCGIQYNKSILHSINAFNHHSIAYKENVCCTNGVYSLR
jgi:hypothetical protein